MLAAASVHVDIEIDGEFFDVQVDRWIFLARSVATSKRVLKRSFTCLAIVHEHDLEKLRENPSFLEFLEFPLNRIEALLGDFKPRRLERSVVHI